MSLWFSSDQHFGHANILRYANRPFVDVQEMDEILVARHNERVGPEDHVWWLGDLALGDIDRSLRMAWRCMGRKTLVVGNHDRVFSGSPEKRALWEERYRTEANIENLVFGHTRIPLTPEVTVLACHFPFAGDSQKDVERFRSHRPDDDESTWLLCGHIHQHWRQQGRQINVGVDAWGGKPVHASKILELIAAGPRDLPPLDW